MKFEDIIYQPIQSPLQGLDKAIATGFEIAQSQAQLRQRQEQIDLQQDQIKQEYMTKGITALSSISKSKGPGRKMMIELVKTYLSKADISVNDAAFEFVTSDEENLKRIDKLKEILESEENPAVQKAMIQNLFGSDAEELPEIFKSIDSTINLSADMQRQLAVEAVKQTYQSQLKSAEAKADVRKEATKRYVEVSKKPMPPKLIERSKELYPGDLGKQAEYRELYFSAVGDRIETIRAGVRAGLPEAKKNPQKYKDLMQALVDAENQYIPNTDKSIDAVNKAEEIFGELKGAYKPKELEVKKEKLKPLSDKQIESLTTFQEIPRLINDIKVSIEKNRSYFGGIRGRAIRLGESIGIQTDVGSTLDQLLSDVKQTVGKLKEGGVLRLEDEKKYERILPSIKDKPEVALNKADLILRDMSSKVKTFVATMKKAGRDVSQFESEINAISVPELPKTISGKEKEPTPQPSGQKKAESAPAKKGVIPFSKLQERAKVRKKTVDEMIQDATNQGYEIDRSR